jgi:hypothetical protein
VITRHLIAALLVTVSAVKPAVAEGSRWHPPSDLEVCQAAWERENRIRKEFGLPSTVMEPRPRPEQMLPGVREVCQLRLRLSDDEVRAAYKWAIEVCGLDGNCP